jgi:YggT family protein
VTLICPLFNIYIIVLFARIILSWFPVQPGGAIAGIYSFLYTITEPVLGPVRRIIPPLGGFDLSPIIVFIGIEVIQRAIGC